MDLQDLINVSWQKYKKGICMAEKLHNKTLGLNYVFLISIQKILILRKLL